MSGNDETPSSKPPLSLDDAERLASQFTPLWEDVPEETNGASAASATPETPQPEAPAAAASEPAAAPAPTSGSAEAAPRSEPVVASEPTPAMVAIAAPMGSSPDIDPNSTELPARRSDYAPPRPLAAAQRTMVGLAPPPAVQVAQSATTTPLGIAAPRSARPALHVVAESSAIGLEPAARPREEVRVNKPAYADVSRTSEPDLELPIRRKRGTRVVVGIVSLAAVLVGAGVLRTVFFKDDDAAKGQTAGAEAPRATAPTKTEPALAPDQKQEQKTATPLPSPSIPQAEPASTVAPVTSAEPSPAPATTESSAPPASPSTGLRLAATRTSPESAQTRAVDTSKTRTPQRVEETKHAQRPVHAPVVPRRPHTEAASRAPVSPPLPGSGAIVRQSPF